jgi:hypothetical protein
MKKRELFIPENPHFETSDLPLATSLKTIGFKLVSFRKDKHQRGIFVFEKNDDIEKAVKSYLNGELMGSLKTYSHAWRDLKDMLYQDLEKKEK